VREELRSESYTRKQKLAWLRAPVAESGLGIDITGDELNAHYSGRHDE